MSTTEPAEPGQEPITVVRSEERLDVRTVYTPTERLRIRKVIVTEERTVTVTLRREELVLEHEPLGASLDGGELGSSKESPEPVTLVLHAEEPVLTTRVVPVERVHVAIDRIVAMQSTTETVRKERVDIRTEPQILDDNAD